jgi:hypothetical protein
MKAVSIFWLPTKRAKRNVTTSAILIILACLLGSTSPTGAQSRTDFAQTRAELNQLSARLNGLTRRMAALERFHPSIICGRMDSDLLKEGTSVYPSSCQLDKDRPSQQLERPRLKAAVIRPGVFSFEFDPPKRQTPLVLATALNTWGDVPVQVSTLRVGNVTQNGFTIETFEATEPINPGNVSFFFVIFSEPPRAE